MVTLARVGVFGAGAVGGTIGGALALAGRDVTLIGQWREHIDAVRKNGLRMVETTGTRVAHPQILHHEELGTLTQPFDVVLLCVKSYDTEWAVKAVAPHVELAEIPGSDHHVTLDNPAEFVKMVLAFYNQDHYNRMYWL